MKLNVLAPIRDLDGTEIRQPPKKVGEDGVILTMGAMMTGALLAPIDGDRADGRESFERFLLAMRIHEAQGVVEISIDEAKLIKDRTAKCCSALVQGRIWQAIEAAGAGEGGSRNSLS